MRAVATPENLALIFEWVAAERADGIAEATLTTKRRMLQRFAEHLGERSLLAVTTGELDEWLTGGTKVAERTVHDRLGHVGAFYQWARQQRLVASSPAATYYRQRALVHADDALTLLQREFRVAQERRALQRSTIDKRQSELRLFAAYLAPRSVLEASSEDVEKYLDARQLTPRVRYAYLSNLHAFYEWATRAGHATGDPTAEIDRPRLPRLVPRPISDEDLTEALLHAPAREGAWIALAAFQGLRCQEIAAVHRDDVLDQMDPPVLVVSRGKGARQRIVPLHPAALEALRRHGLRRGAYLFPKARGKPIAAYTVSTVGSRYLSSVGVEATMHQLRHWFGSRLYATTRDLRLVQEMMGHSSPTTTSIYVAFNPGDAVAAVQGLAVRAT